MVRPLAALVLAALAVAGTPATVPRAGSIRGQVVVPHTPVAAARPSVADLWTTRPDPVDRRRSVVYLDSAPRQAFEELRPGRAKMDQRGQQFIPRVLAITVGTTVDFPNSDSTFHNAFSLAPAGPFDLGRYRPGRTRSIRFDRPGIVPVSCDIHSHMSAYILVFNHPFFAVTDEDGRYSIPGVPSGPYTLAVWSEIGRPATRKVTVVDGDTVEVNFQVGRSGS
ncbi:MAG TPA: carboxypeptidase regulatory-like domain-containing protein [Vicinamibacterales bacterium]|nr:carboxypeptidase regulatory-like domain-containing protein [Vicinamibacterales bacterium]